MEPLDKLRAVVTEGRTIRLVEDGIYSVLPDAAHNHLYDRRAAVYDRLVGTRFYNRVMWGASPRDYTEFARRAAVSPPPGRLLDAGCGSLLFTAGVYLECNRQVIAFDQSLRMLRRARMRLLELAGAMPEHICLLQADLNDLPFRAASFSTALCMNVLHQFADAAELMPKLKALLISDGHLYLTSLVANGRFIGDHYLSVLHRAGEFVRPRSSLELKELLNDSLSGGVSYQTDGNMAYATTAAFR